MPFLDSLHYTRNIATKFFKEASIGVLYYNTCDYDCRKEIQKVSKDFFKTVKKNNIQTVFIDVSWNGGGSDLTNEYIYKYLKREPYEVHGVESVTDAGVALLEPRYKRKSEEPIIKALKEIVAQKKVSNSEFISSSEQVGGNSTGFEGNVFVIIGRGTYSSAYAFSESIKRAKAGVLIGESTGQRAPFAASSIDLTLPNSGFEFLCSTFFFSTEPVVFDKDGFLQPDLPFKMEHPLTLDDYKTIIRMNNQIK